MAASRQLFAGEPQESCGPAPLNAAQLAFLRFTAVGEPPHRWEWLDAAGGANPMPGAAVTLRARKRVGTGLKHLLISADDLRGLEPFWAKPLLELNAAGRAVLKANPEPKERHR